MTSKVIVETDHEPSIQYFVKDLVESRPQGQTVNEESPVKSSGSNGVVERGVQVQVLEGQLRVMLLAFESRIGREVRAKEPIVTPMPEYGAYLLNRRDQGRDGKTSYERCKGKRAIVLRIEFGEKFLYNARPEREPNDIGPLAARRFLSELGGGVESCGFLFKTRCLQ